MRLRRQHEGPMFVLAVVAFGLIVTMGFTSMASAATDTVGIIRQVVGKATIMNGGEELPAHPTTPLHQGDVLSVDAGAHVSGLISAHGSIRSFSVAGPAERTIFGQPAPGLISVIGSYGHASAERGANPGDADQHPRYTAVHKLPVMLSWSPEIFPALTGFTVEGGSERTVSAVFSDNTVKIHGTKANAGRYRWTAEFADGTQAEGVFKLLSAEEFTACRTSYDQTRSMHDAYAKAQSQIGVLVECELYLQALARTSLALEEEFPDDDVLLLIERGLLARLASE